MYTFERKNVLTGFVGFCVQFVSSFSALSLKISVFLAFVAKKLLIPPLLSFDRTGAIPTAVYS